MNERYAHYVDGRKVGEWIVELLNDMKKKDELIYEYESTKCTLLIIWMNGMHISDIMNDWNAHFWHYESTECTFLTLWINGMHINNHKNEQNAQY